MGRGTRTLYLVRDRLGIKPLYLARLPGMLLFASTLSGVLAYPDFPREVDRSAAQHLPVVPVRSGAARDLPRRGESAPGDIVEIDVDGDRERTYWDLFEHWREAEGRPRTEAGEYEEELFALLASSIRYRSISDGPLGAFLSGGIDSSLVVALMRKAASGPVKTFSIGFRSADTTSRGTPARSRRTWERTTTRRSARPRRAQALVRRIPDTYDEPFADSSSIPTMLVSAFTRDHVTVSLSGDGGDELFCGYPRYNWVR